MNSIFADPGWIAFVEQKHQLNHRFLTAGTLGDDTAFAQILVFVNSRGKIRTPRLMPYMPVHLQTTQTTSLTKLQRQWLTLGSELARQMRDIGYGGALSLDPQVQDVRPWQWQGTTAEVRYTMTIELPTQVSNFSHSTRKQIKKALRSGYTAELTDDVDAIVACLRETEERQSFGYGLTADDLLFLRDHMSEGSLRMYLAKSPDGEPASSRVILAPAGGVAIDLVAGTVTGDLRNGVTQLIIAHALEDLATYGTTSFDYGGANIESVAASKMEWGVQLTPFYTISEVNLRSTALLGKRWITKVIREVKM